MTSKNANANLAGLERALLQLYGKSGAGAMYNPIAYSDKDKVSEPLSSPTLTILAETVPGRFYSQLDESLIASGLLPRFMTFEYKGERPYLNENRQLNPPHQLVAKLGDFTATAVAAMESNIAHNVRIPFEAGKLLDEFERQTTDEINGCKSQVTKQLWNRAHLKALKLAGLWGALNNPHNPETDERAAKWAIDLVRQQTLDLIAKFETGETGVEAGDEAKQLNKMRLIIKEYLMAGAGTYESSGCMFEIHRDHIFTHKYLSNRLLNLAMFKDGNPKGSRAILQCVEQLIRNGDISRVPPDHMKKTYGRTPQAYHVIHLNEFLASLPPTPEEAEYARKTRK